MKDGYAGLYNAETEEEAKRLAVEAATRETEHAAMTPREKQVARTVDYADELS